MYKSSYNNNYKPRTNNYKPYVRRPFVKVENTYGFQKNEMIQAPRVMVIDIDGNNLGEMSKMDAINQAVKDGLTLVAVSPQLPVPVCKIVDWEKFRYEQQKKQRPNKQSSDLREMWFGINIGEGDLNHKVSRIIEFLEEKSPVKIEVRAKGGRYQQDIHKIVMKKILDKLEGMIKIDAPAKYEGKKYSIIVYPAAKK